MRTRSRALVAVAAVAPVALLAAPTVAASPPQWTGKPYTIELTGAAEVPGPGDSDATGTARLRVNPGQEQLCYRLTVRDVDGTIVGAHIHEAPAGEAGPIVVPLNPPVDGSSSGCLHVERDLARRLVSDPESYYVNVHSLPDFGPGAVRGQLG